MSIDKRREAVLSAAMIEFAKYGYEAASTTAIAQRVGVSQPYLFKLFPTKHAIFMATIERSVEEIETSLRKAAEGLTGLAAIDAMRNRYIELLTETKLLQFQLQLFSAASADTESQELGRRALAQLWCTVAELTGEEPAEILRFFSTGMLLNVMIALGIPVRTDRNELAVSLHEWAAQSH
ncbi:MAG: TetR/AcrR family transcriptional regulator [Desulfosporosinus sp.]|nr:TetR/AcrR family transcriptional regulator [Desulfosporosinus sp.]